MSVHSISRVVGARVWSGLCVEALGSAHRRSPPISHVIRWSDKLAMMRKPQNSNDLNSKFERVVRELRAKFRGGELHAKLRWGRGTPGGLWVPGISGRRTLRGVGHGHRMITILIHIHVRST